jgi:hypothetical protein
MKTPQPSAPESFSFRCRFKQFAGLVRFYCRREDTRPNSSYHSIVIYFESYQTCQSCRHTLSTSNRPVFRKQRKVFSFGPDLQLKGFIRYF